MSKELNIYAVKFKGINGVGFIGGVTEEAARRVCKRYTAKLVSIKFDHKMKLDKKKGNK